jgi:hypothetical protein
MPRARMTGLLRTVVILFLCIALGRAESVVTEPFAGVTHIHRTETLPRALSMHVIRIDLAQRGIRFKLTRPAGSRETIRQTTLDFLRQEKAQIAINAHFFLPYPTDDAEVYLIGLAASEGDVYSGFEHPDQSYALVDEAPALNLDPQNHAAIVSRNSSIVLWNAVSGSAQIVVNGTKSIPVYRDAEHPAGALQPGGPNAYSNADSWYERPNARTAIGITRDSRTLILFTVDRSATSQGLTVGEMADLLIADYNVADALNLDGGGSTTLAMEDPASKAAMLVNVPAEGPPGRAVGSSLAVFANAR